MAPHPWDPSLTLHEWYARWAWTSAAWESQWDRWYPWDVEVAKQASVAIENYMAVSEGWYSNSHCGDCFSAGIRDAYYHGLAIAVPTGPSELGYAVDSAT